MIKLHYLDANCLVKLVLTEVKSDELQKYFFQPGAVFASSTFCFHEALGVLKSKWLSKNRPDHISSEQYFAACEDLCAMVEDRNISLDDISVADRGTFNEAERIATDNQIDLSDALQLITLKRGMFARLQIGAPILVTEDRNLRRAAKAHKLQAVDIASLQVTERPLS